MGQTAHHRYDVVALGQKQADLWAVAAWRSNMTGWWFEPLWKIGKSIGMIIPNIWWSNRWSNQPDDLTNQKSDLAHRLIAEKCWKYPKETLKYMQMGIAGQTVLFFSNWKQKPQQACAHRQFCRRAPACFGNGNGGFSGWQLLPRMEI